MNEKRFYIDNSGDLWDRQSNDILMMDFGDMKAVYVNAVLDCMNELNEENMMLKQLNIPFDEIEETVSDSQGRIIAIYYKR